MQGEREHDHPDGERRAEHECPTDEQPPVPVRVHGGENGETDGDTDDELYADAERRPLPTDASSDRVDRSSYPEGHEGEDDRAEYPANRFWSVPSEEQPVDP